MITQSELERDRYEARLKWQRDYAAALDDARREGESRAEEVLAQQVLRFQGILGLPLSPLAELQQQSLPDLTGLVRTLEDKLAEALRRSE